MLGAPMNAYAKPITTSPDGSYFTPPEELDAAEVTAQHVDAAIEQMIAKNIAGIAEIVNDDPFWKELFSEAVDKVPSWRRLLKDSDQIKAIAQEIADNEAAAQREQSAIDDAFEEEVCHQMFSPE